MILTRFQQFLGSTRQGVTSGFAAGLVILFLILIGIPINIQSLALFLLLLVILAFGVRLARRMLDAGATFAHLLKNALAMSVVAALIVFLLMSLINRWQAKGIDVKNYFDAVSLTTMNVLSGVPEAELHPNPAKDVMTGEYPEGAKLRTDPMRLTFDSETGLRLKLGLTGEAWVDVNLIIGGFYGFMLLLGGVGVAGALITWAANTANLGRYRKRTAGYLSENPVVHWVVLCLPLLLFGFLWLTKGQDGIKPIIRIGGGGQEVQLLTGFAIILFGLVAMRAAQPVDWKLAYPVRVGIVSALVAGLTALAIWRIVSDKIYFIATSDQPRGHELLCVIIVLLVAGAAIVQNVLALRTPERFESQLAATLALAILLILPLYLDQYQNDVMTLVGINILLGLGLNIVVGYAGLLDLGYVAFFALGAYTYAFLSSNQVLVDASGNPDGLKFEGNDEVVIRVAAWAFTAVIVATVIIVGGLFLWRRSRLAHNTRAMPRRQVLPLDDGRPTRSVTALLTVIAIAASLFFAALLDNSSLYHDLFNGASPFLVGLVAGVIVSGLSGIMLGIPVLRLRGDYLAIVTLGFGEIIRLLFTNLRDFTGGPQGILQIPRPLPENASGPVSYLSIIYLVVMGAGLVAFSSARLKQSRTGRAWSAMKSDEAIAQSMGVNLVQSKLTAFAIGAAFAGIGGVLFAARQRNIFPNDFKLDVSIEVLSLVIIGGMGSIPGVIMGAVALIGVPEVLRELSTYRILAFGALLVTMVIIRPKGLLPAPTPQLQERARALVQRRLSSEERSS